MVLDGGAITARGLGGMLAQSLRNIEVQVDVEEDDIEDTRGLVARSCVQVDKSQQVQPGRAPAHEDAGAGGVASHSLLPLIQHPSKVQGPQAVCMGLPVFASLSRPSIQQLWGQGGPGQRPTNVIPCNRSTPNRQPPQDVKYLSMKARSDANKAQRLRESLHFIGATAAPPPAASTAGGSGAAARHVVFVDSEKEAKTFDPVEYFKTPAELLGRTFNRPRAEQLADKRTVLGGGGTGSSKGVEK